MRNKLTDSTKALLVLLLTRETRAYILENDPQAFRQAEDAILGEGAEVREHYQNGIDRLRELAEEERKPRYYGYYDDVKDTVVLFPPPHVPQRGQKKYCLLVEKGEVYYFHEDGAKTPTAYSPLDVANRSVAWQPFPQGNPFVKRAARGRKPSATPYGGCP